MNDATFPHALARKWIREFAEQICLTIALRDLTQRKINRGQLRSLMTSGAVSLLETADQLAAFGLRPVLGLAGAEAELWSQLVRFATRIAWVTPPVDTSAESLAADLAQMQSAWDQFEKFVSSLPDDFCEGSAVLSAGTSRGESHLRVFGPRISPTAVIENCS